MNGNNILQWIQKVLNEMVAESGRKDISEAKVLMSDQMSNEILKWSSIYNDHSPWLDKKEDIFSIGLGADISSEMAILTTLELETRLEGSEFADALNETYQELIGDIRTYTEYGCAKGGCAFRPSFTGEKFTIDFIQGEHFYPTSFDTSGRITGAVFVEQIKRNDTIYTRFEWQDKTSHGYMIINKAYASSEEGILGDEIPLSYVFEWENVPDAVILPGVDVPLFGYFKIPTANKIDNSSPLGPSVFASAVDLIKQADEHWARINREYKLTEPAISVADAMLKTVDDKSVIPKGYERLYRAMPTYSGINEKPFYEEWMPNIRHEALFSGLNRILQRIEFSCGLAYGTLSDMQLVTKTAEEIRSSKQRSYATVKDIQNSLENALTDVIYALVALSSVHDIGISVGEVTPIFEWGDSIIIDKQTEIQDMRADVAAGLIRPELYIMKKYGVTEEEALEMLPKIDESIPDPSSEGEE